MLISSFISVVAPHSSACLIRSIVAPKMQYGQQGYGDFGAQPGYGAQPSYGAQNGYNPQGAGHGAPLWRIDGFSSVTGHHQNCRTREDAEKYAVLPYLVPGGTETVLGRWNMMMPSPYVSRVQALVRVAHDGTPLLVSCGRAATLWRRGSGGPWNGLVQGSTHFLASGDQVSLSIANPEGAVLTCVQLQGGYAEQDFRPEPLQVPQLDGYSQQGGYDSGYWQPQQHQQGGYQGQGGYRQHEQTGYQDGYPQQGGGGY